MNWDISMGRARQLFGRLLQRVGGQLGDRPLVLSGESHEYAGRLQARYGALKHQVQWGLLRPIPIKQEPVALNKSALR
jgi:uncharacterized protein YjbJ (UPF0337 family)